MKGLKTILQVLARCTGSHSAPRCCFVTDSTATDSSRPYARTASYSPRPHTPVLLKEVLSALQPQPDGIYLDMTLGAGGHAAAILDHAPGCRIYGLDRDPVALQHAQRLAHTYPNFTPLKGRFSEVHHLLAAYGVGISSIDGILFDVGASSMQFDDSERGFALSKLGPLDMRMDRESQKLTAANVVNGMDESDLYHIVRQYGEERKARLIARAIVDHRYAFGKISNTKELAQIVTSVYESSSAHHQDKLGRPAHVATRTFQALRIFVNDELNELYNGLEIAHALLKPGGVCVAIAFHSLEDRIIKRCFHGIDMDAQANMSVTSQMRNSARIHDRETITELLQKKWQPISKKVLSPTAQEISANPRARSAKLRVALKKASDSTT